MSGDVEELVYAVVLGALGAVGTTGWWAARGWVVKRLLGIVVAVVEHLAHTRVHQMKQANEAASGNYDLLPTQAREVMREAKNEVIAEAMALDAKTPFFVPKVARLARDTVKLEETIEAVVQKRKGRTPKGPGKGFR